MIKAQLRIAHNKSVNMVRGPQDIRFGATHGYGKLTHNLSSGKKIQVISMHMETVKKIICRNVIKTKVLFPSEIIIKQTKPNDF